MMGLLSKLLSKKAPEVSTVDDGVADMIRLYDANGNEFRISRSEYLKEVLPNAFEKAWSTPDDLYQAIIVSLQDGFMVQSLEPARRLLEIDHDRERSTIILGIALMKNSRLDEAQAVFETYLKDRPDSAVMVTNLAKTFAGKGQDELALSTLWKGLTIDPNQDSGLIWWGALGRDRGGEEGFYEAMEKAATIPGSWRPQLWLARRQLEQKRITSALQIYRNVMPLAVESSDALMMISGDLGNNGYLIQMLELILPAYKPEKHGYAAGINLLQSCIHLGEREVGLKLCDDIERLQRFDIKQYLEQLKTQLISLPGANRESESSLG